MNANKTSSGNNRVLKPWRELAALALAGLEKTYGDGGLPRTRAWIDNHAVNQGVNVRYALISLLGLGRMAAGPPRARKLIDVLWDRVDQSLESTGVTAGDLGLGLWARMVTGRGPRAFSADVALRALRNDVKACDSVDLAWLLCGADAASESGEFGACEDLMDAAKGHLLGLYNERTRLFYRHDRRGPTQSVSRRVACFANQIYPVMALGIHARRRGCAEALKVAGDVADNLVALQGKHGQWWWLYDAASGGVVDGYPVFSVHQDGMAPMALLELMNAGGRDFGDAIHKGLQWIFGKNELGQSMVLENEGLVLRDIHKRGVGRMSRMIEAGLWVCGWRRGDGRALSGEQLEVNPECRPYHLGWILYAASLIEDVMSRECQLVSAAS